MRMVTKVKKRRLRTSQGSHLVCLLLVITAQNGVVSIATARNETLDGRLMKKGLRSNEMICARQ